MVSIELTTFTAVLGLGRPVVIIDWTAQNPFVTMAPDAELLRTEHFPPDYHLKGDANPEDYVVVCTGSFEDKLFKKPTTYIWVMKKGE